MIHEKRSAVNSLVAVFRLGQICSTRHASPKSPCAGDLQSHVWKRMHGRFRLARAVPLEQRDHQLEDLPERSGPEKGGRCEPAGDEEIQMPRGERDRRRPGD